MGLFGFGASTEVKDGATRFLKPTRAGSEMHSFLAISIGAPGVPGGEVLRCHPLIGKTDIMSVEWSDGGSNFRVIVYHEGGVFGDDNTYHIDLTVTSDGYVCYKEQTPSGENRFPRQPGAPLEHVVKRFIEIFSSRAELRRVTGSLVCIIDRPVKLVL